MTTSCAVGPAVIFRCISRWVSAIFVLSLLTGFIAVDMLPNNTFNHRNFTRVLPKRTYVHFALWVEV